MTSERRLKVADMTAQGYSPAEIEKELGYGSTHSVYKAQGHPEVKEQIAFLRDNLFSQSRIDRVALLRELYQRATAPTGEIFKILRGGGDFLNAENLEKLDEFDSRLIQQVEIEPSTITIEQLDEDGEVQTLKRTVSMIKKLRFHSPDAALKILSKAAGFEDGIPDLPKGSGGGPFRGLTILPPRETVAPVATPQRAGPDDHYPSDVTLT